MPNPVFIENMLIQMRNIFLVCFLLLVFSAKGQDSPAFPEILDTEKELDSLFTELYTLEDSPKRDSLNIGIISRLSESLETWDGYHFRWDSLNNIGNLFSEDRNMRVFTWYLQKQNGEYKYYGIIALRFETGLINKKEEFAVIELMDRSSSVNSPEKKYLGPEEWYGCVYYNIKTFSHRGNPYYVLSGFDFNNNFSNKKLLEVLQVKDNKPVFGAEFHNKEKLQQRMIFEYSATIAMTLRFDDNLNMFVYDHLSPFNPIFRGSYRFYGPDGSFDAIRFDNGEFFVVEDVDARNE